MTTYVVIAGQTVAAADADAPALLLTPGVRLASVPEIAEYAAALTVGGSQIADPIPEDQVQEQTLSATSDPLAEEDGTAALTTHEGS